ncbi:hypothetical protein [Kitasatospora sp. NPDC002040]|uniref:hypothetical protein n=1 Tax=Kitasatospora sp. NPDC002040 TaxID=3154661 RepID=UPI00332B7847
MAVVKNDQGAYAAQESPQPDATELMTALANFTGSYRAATAIKVLFEDSRFEPDVLVAFATDWLAQRTQGEYDWFPLSGNLFLRPVPGPVGKNYLPGEAVRKTRAMQHLAKRLPCRHDGCRDLPPLPRPLLAVQGPAWHWRPADPVNLLAIVAELDAAVSASESGARSAAIGHIEAAKESILEDAQPLRVSAAAQILGLSRRTVDAWVESGLLIQVTEPGTTVKLVDPRRLYEIKVLVDDLRATGMKRGLTDAVWQRLQDRHVLEDERLHESLQQMRTGQGVSLEELRARMGAEDDEDPDADES